jgi:uncharacterized protein YciI
MKQLFAVTRARGPAWEDTKPLEGQAEWSAHAAFMDALAAERFVLLAGPLEGFREALIIIRAGSTEEIDTRLAADPWTKRELLRTTRIAPWTLRLGSLE